MYMYYDLLDLFNSFQIRRKFFLISLTCLLLHCLVLLLLQSRLNSVLLTKLPFLSSFFICAKARIQTEEAITQHNHTTPIIYYKTSKWRTATATEDKWNRPSSLRTWKRCDTKRRRRIKVVRARASARRCKIFESQTNRRFCEEKRIVSFDEQLITLILSSLFHSLIENTRNRKSYKTR